MRAVELAALAIIVAAAFVCAAFVLRSHRLVDRAIGLDSMVALLESGMAIAAAHSADGLWLDLVLLTVVLGFLATVTVARYVQRRGR